MIGMTVALKVLMKAQGRRLIIKLVNLVWIIVDNKRGEECIMMIEYPRWALVERESADYIEDREGHILLFDSPYAAEMHGIDMGIEYDVVDVVGEEYY